MTDKILYNTVKNVYYFLKHFSIFNKEYFTLTLHMHIIDRICCTCGPFVYTSLIKTLQKSKYVKGA
jgi:hypothetical protein